MVENVVCHTYQCIFFAVHNTVFTYESQTVHIWVYNNTKVVSALLYFCHNTAQIFLYWFRVVSEIACWIAV